MTLLTKIAGPKVLLGIITASVLTVVFLGYLLRNAYEAAGVAQAEARQLRETIKGQQVELSYLRYQNTRQERAVMQAIVARDKAETLANKAQRNLRKDLADNECAQTKHPDSVSQWLHEQSSNPDRN